MMLSLMLAAVSTASITARDLTPLKDVEVGKGEIAWIADGKAAFPIVANMRDQEVAQAAKFLQSCVKDMTGVSPRIVAKTKEKVAVRIANYTPASGAFTVEIGKDGVTLAGNGPYAAYDFAERVLNVRQYFDPKSGGRSVVKADKVVLPFVKWSDAPVYLRREMHPGRLPWTANFKKGNQLIHGHRVHVPRWASNTNEDYKVTRPEIFELKADGQRGKGNMLCYGNPMTLETYVERIDEELRGGRKSGMIVMPHQKTINVSQDDAGLACHCEDCLKLRDKSLGGSGEYAPVLWKHFVPKLSDIAAKKWPDYTISILPYHNTCLCLPDVHFTNGNVEATLVTHPGLALLKDPTVKAEEEAKMREWQACTGRKIVNWHYLIYPATFTSAPYLFGDAIVAHYRDMKDVIAGTYVDQYSIKRHGHELDLYVWFRAMWNPDVDPNAVYDVFCERMFGPAAPEVREVIRMICDGWKRPWAEPFVSPKNVFGTSYPVAETRKMKALFEKARPKLEGDAHALLCFDYYTGFFKTFFEDSEDFASGGSFTPLEIMKTTERPKVDGILDDEAWQKAKKADFVEGVNAERKLRPPAEAGEVRAVWTPGTGVTFGYRCAEAHMDRVVKTADPLRNDQIELFLDPSGAGNGGYMQLAFDVNGLARFYRSGRGAGDWIRDGVQVAVHMDKDFWSAEVYIPFEALKNFPGARLPDLGAVNLYWVGNTTRMQFGGCVGDDYSKKTGYFSRLFTKFHHFNNHAPAFGKLMFKEW